MLTGMTTLARLLSALVGVAAWLGLRDDQPFASDLGFATALAMTGIAGAVLSILAIAAFPALRIPLGLAAVAGVVVAGSAWWPPVTAGDANEYTASIAGVGAGVVMGVSAMIGVFVRNGRRPDTTD